ncbi:DNA/RNA non-specific endonuclease [Microcoleus sp. MON1_C5]|uniref:DNA/RNA non-specific endonuclease n=1 Tax=Microcoleus sp. MON1_C5 TaxID=2818828 RepID=UPI00403F0F59
MPTGFRSSSINLGLEQPIAQTTSAQTILSALLGKVRPSNNKGSGYNRGHIAPSADHTRNAANNRATFLMSNMMPQMPKLNRPVWRNLRKSRCN